MSANRKSVFLSDQSLDILGPFSSGRLNLVIEKYGYLIQTEDITAIFSPSELELLYQITKEQATQEWDLWREVTARKLWALVMDSENIETDKNNQKLAGKMLTLTPVQEVALIETIDRHWAEERDRLFKAYQERKMQAREERKRTL
ncbi:MAG: hypothetical protein KDI39_17410 [Pseudomonadales bacterium]|nr:hypothetical protein [Pseudomonadales bacterium]